MFKNRKNLAIVLLMLTLSVSLFAKTKSPFVDIIQQNRDAVVQIKVESTISNNYRSPFQNDDFFKFFFPQQPQVRPYVSLGSGFIFNYDKKSKTAFILTNNHVVELGDKGTITVTLADKNSIVAEIVGLDPATDLAVIKIEVPKNEKVTVLELGDSEALDIGEWAIAIGNPFGDSGLERTVTVGVISALGRAGMNFGNNSPAFQDYIQTDAAINPGNSGGPLLDIDGKVIGINAAITSNSGGNVGIGFAIPVNLAKKVSSDIIEHGYVRRGYLGIMPQEITEDLKINFDLTELAGVLVTNVEDKTPASKAKLKKGDIIKSLNGTKIHNIHKFRTEIAHSPIGSPVEISIIRDKKQMTLNAVLTEHPEFMKDGKQSTSKSKYDVGLKVAERDSEFSQKFNNTINKGVLVQTIARGSSAASTSLQIGDVIFEVNNVEVNSVAEFDAEIEKALGTEENIKRILLRVAIKNKNNLITYVAINIRD
ncbi:MAG: trypsin-like peptidase domain-containing protein [Candidatus Cloacimonadales bacterium]